MLVRPHFRWPGAALALLITAALAAACFRLEFSIEYRAVELLRSDWGSQPGQFGRARGRDGAEWGPRSFAVGGDRLVILDTVCSRLQFFSADGRLLEVVPAPSAAVYLADVALRPPDTVVLDLHVEQVLRLLAGHWSELASWPPPADKSVLSHRLDSLSIAPGGTVYVGLTRVDRDGQTWELLRIDGLSPPVTVLELRTDTATLTTRAQPPLGLPAGDSVYNVVALAPGPGGRIYLQVTSSAWPGSALVEFDEQSGRSTMLMPPVSHGQDDFPRLVGVDGRGYVYLAYGLDGSEGQVLVCDPAGRQVGMVQIGPSPVRCNVRVRVDERGQIYVISQDEQGVRLVRHYPSRALQVIPRWVRP
jgi:hypothetical protein